MRILSAILVLAIAMPMALAQEGPVVFDVDVGTNPDGSMYLTPNNITVQLGQTVTLRVHNPDRIFHDVALLDYDGNDIEIEVPAGRTVEHTFEATQAGDFRLICEVSGHKQKGMQGTLHVVDPNATPGAPIAAILAALVLAALVAGRRR